jgi:fumarate reductase subunit D
MAGSHKPIVWGLFAGGGTVAAFVLPALILLTSLAVPLGLLPAESLAYDRVLAALQHPLARLMLFGVVFLMIWHAAHRTRITAHDFGVRQDALVMWLCYGIAAVGSVVAAVSLLRLGSTM